MKIEAFVFVLTFSQIASANVVINDFHPFNTLSNHSSNDSYSYKGPSTNFSTFEDEYLHDIHLIEDRPPFTHPKEDIDTLSSLLDFCKNIFMFINFFQDEPTAKDTSERTKRLDLMKVLTQTKDKISETSKTSYNATKNFAQDAGQKVKSVVTRNASDFEATGEKQHGCMSKILWPQTHEGASRVKFLFLMNFPGEMMKAHAMSAQNLTNEANFTPASIFEHIRNRSIDAAGDNNRSVALAKLQNMMGPKLSNEVDDHVWVWNVKNLFNLTENPLATRGPLR